MLLLTQMGTVPLVGAVVILSIGLVWYLGYVRGRVRREGVARQAMREEVSQRLVERTENTFTEATDHRDVTVALGQETTPPHEAALIHLGATVARKQGGSVTVVRFDTVPDQMPLGSAAGMQSPDDLEFEERMEQFKDDLDVSLDYGEIVSHAPGHAVVNFADHHNTDLMIVEDTSVGGGRSWVRGSEIEWIARHVHCDLLLFHPSRFEGLRRIVLVTDNGPFDPSKVEIGDAPVQHVGARLVLTHTIPPDATDDHRATLQKYHDQLTTLCSVPTDSRFLETNRPVDIADALDDDDLLVVGSDDSWWNRLLDKRQSHRIVEAFDGPSLVVRAHRETSPGPVERLVERFAL